MEDIRFNNIINGGIYRVFFNGIHGSEFKGEHPALIIRTLKENEIYLVIPFSTYTKEKMEKIKENGYGLHIKSTNSIARIDKLQIIHLRDIKNRWMDGKSCLKLHPDEFDDLNKEINKYIVLSLNKSHKEYFKYFNQYENLMNNIYDIENNKIIKNNSYNVSINNNVKVIDYNKSEINELTKKDVVDIFSLYYNIDKIEIDFNIDKFFIEIKLKL